MDESIVEIPWGLLRQLLDKFQAQLNKGFQQASRNESCAYLELTIYTQPANGEAPIAEYNIGGGQVGKRLPIDNDIAEEEEQTDQLQADDQRTEPARLLREMYDQLNQVTGEVGIDAIPLRMGVRALVYSPNPGYYCSGYRCEWRPSVNAWWLRYYYLRSGQCRKRWVNPC
jgi:hypothetical protein